MDSKHLLDLIVLVHRNAEDTGYRGFDPYDIKAIPFFSKWSNVRYLGYVQDRLLSLAPNLLRRLFRVQQALNPKALALFGLGYVNLFEATGDKVWIEKARSSMEKLITVHTKWGAGAGWGYPFNWQSRVFFPAGTPSGVVTSFCLHSIVRYQELTGERQFEQELKRAADFLADGLRKDFPSDDRLCFSYTPLDMMHVHNANVLSAAALLAAYGVLKDGRYLELAVKAFNYTVSEQQQDGSWFYFGDADRIPGHVDNFHTGFVLRALQAYKEFSGDSRTENSVKLGYDFYRSHLFFDEYLPRYSSKADYPVDIHACADSLITLSRFSSLDESAVVRAGKLVDWAVANMFDGRGGFYFQKYPFMTSKITYMRWNNAWMFYGLTEYLKCI